MIAMIRRIMMIIQEYEDHEDGNDNDDDYLHLHHPAKPGFLWPPHEEEDGEVLDEHHLLIFIFTTKMVQVWSSSGSIKNDHQHQDALDPLDNHHDHPYPVGHRVCAGSSEVPVDDHHRHKDAGDKDDALEDDDDDDSGCFHRG